MFKGIITAALFGFFLTFNIEAIEASMISFYVIETGLPEKAERNKHSTLWENAFMDVFFDHGYIITNYPMLRLGAKPEESIIKASGFDVDEAKDAGIEYILIAQLDYDSLLKGPEEITFYLFTVAQHEIIYEKKISGKSYGLEKDEFNDLKTIIKEFVRFVSNF
ncbi:MAG: hypothetical protein LBC76_03480 [Treponema sp.]|jgi:hypothetical protein|nr:hypothetical protein [Treponema sp.]